MIQASSQALTMEAPLSPETKTNMKSDKHKIKLSANEHLPWVTPEEFNYLLKRVEELEEKIKYVMNLSR